MINFKNWLKANKKNLVSGAISIMGLYAIIYFIASNFPNIIGYLIIIGFVVWYIYDEYLKGPAVRNYPTVNYEEVYEYLHESILNSITDIYRIAGCSGAVPKSIRVNPEHRSLQNDKGIWYAFDILLPETFKLDTDDFQDILNQNLYSHLEYGSAIPIVFQILRKGQKLRLIATTCMDDQNYYKLREQIGDRCKTKSKYTSDKKDEDF